MSYIRTTTILICGIILLILFGCNNTSAQNSINSDDFKNPPKSVKLHTWWHWMDGAITKEGITKDLEAMKAQGIVQATILNVSLFDGRDFGVPQIKFNSPQWYEMFRWALLEANRLGIVLGVHNCDGWSTNGGPWITPEMSMKQFVWTKETVKGGENLTIKLAKPYAEKNFYRDVAVVAFKTELSPNSFQLANPKVIVNDSVNASLLFDGNPISNIMMKQGDKINIYFESEFTADKIAIHTRNPFLFDDLIGSVCRFSVSTSSDGINYSKVKDIELIGLNKNFIIPIQSIKAKYFKLELTHSSNYSNRVKISEVELIKSTEQPSYSPLIPYHLEKIVSVRPKDRKVINITDTINLIGGCIDEKSIIDITSKMAEDGTLTWNVPDSNWTIIRFGYTTTSQTNGPAAKEGTGLECDKMDTTASSLHFMNFSQKLIDQAGEYKGNTFESILIDSWECAYQNWTNDMPVEFEKRRGYSLINWIPVLCGETIHSTEQSEGFLYDFRKTIADLIEQNYYKHFSELCHRQKMKLNAEVGYGDTFTLPMDILKSNSYIDMPMSEFWANSDKQSLPEYIPKPHPSTQSPFPAHSSVIYDKQIIGSEAYTNFANYSESPFYLKSFGDAAFCSGINQIILHSYVHQPFDKKPGMTLGYFGAHFNRNNPWWKFASDWLNYQARIQYMLQKGETAIDVLLYVGDQLPQYIDNNKIAIGLPFGYRVNACNFDILKNKATVKDGKIIFGNQKTCSMLILPDNPTIELSTLQRISELVNDGAVLYGAKPVKMLSLKGIKENKSDFQKLVDTLWGNDYGNGVIENDYGKGKVFWGKPIGQILNQLDIVPDFTASEDDSLNLMYIHKKLGNYDIYFVANQKDTIISREFLFRVTGKTPEIWNPENGTIVKPAIYSVENDQTRIPVSLNPREALFFVFNNNKPDNYIQKVSVANEQIFPTKQIIDSAFSVPQAVYCQKGFSLTAVQNGEYSFMTNKNKKIKAKVKQAEVFEIKDFKGTIEFFPIYDSNIQPVEISDLKSYTDFQYPEIKYFAGDAKYKIKFNLPANYSAKNDSVLLCLGNIDATGEVRLNNHLLGYIWLPGRTFNVNSLIKSENQLEIVISNVCRNRILGDFIEYGKLRNIWTSNPTSNFQGTKMQLKPSGLMGPLYLIKYKNQIVIK